MPPPLTFTNTVRYSTLALCVLAFVLSLFALIAFGRGLPWFVLSGALVALGIHDLNQTRHAILRNYPILGWLRFGLEFIRPEIRQYFIESDTEAQPFSRAQRSVVYQRAKGEPDNRPFGTQLDVGVEGYEWINHSLHTTHIESQDFRLWIGGRPGAPLPGVAPCTQPYSASVFNISAMSFGALSANAILALNQGAKIGGFAHDTGEGSISQYHRVHGGDLIWEIGSGYFGCRTTDGHFSPERFAEQARDAQIRMIELKLSQGAKPGHGGMLPAAKVTPEIAAARGVPVGMDCISPSAHSAFATPIELMQFIAQLRQLSGGKPTGFKLCIGHPWEWFAIVKAMLATDITPDFIVVDGAEGGTGAAPVEFTDHVGTPLQEGLRLVHNTLVGVGLRERISLGCAGKVTNAFNIARMVALGADWAKVRLLSSLMPQMAPGAILNDLGHLPNVYRLYWPLASADSFDPREPAPGEAPPDLRVRSGVRPSGAPPSAYEVARQLRPAQAPGPAARTTIEPTQAPPDAATPASATEVPDAWRGSDAR